MDFNKWFSTINLINNTYFINKQPLVNLIQTVKSKYLILQELNIHKKNNQLLTKEYTLIWDCEFQVFKSPKNIMKNKNTICTIQYEHIDNNKMIRCISEIGMILILNLNNKLYLAGLFHIGFFNNKLNDNFLNYTPFYHEYMSVLTTSEKKIINIEKKIYPHLIFENIWNHFLNNNNIDQFQENIIKLLNNKILKYQKNILIKFSEQLNELINLLETKNNTDKIIQKIITNLKSIIYNKLIQNLNSNNSFKKINKIYINDKYIKNILIDIPNHKNVINNINLIVSNNNCLNIIKGLEDIKALNNHNLLLNGCNNNVLQDNIIDIADYNSKIYKLCNTAKLYESYLCLNKEIKYNNESNNKIIKELKKYMSNNFKPHNPLVDAYYTLQVFILYNML